MSEVPASPPLPAPRRDRVLGKRVALLLLEDREEEAAAVERALARDGLDRDLRRVRNWEGFLTALDAGPWDCILSDCDVPGMAGGQALEWALLKAGQAPLLLVSGEIGEERTVEVLRAGAADVVRKDHLERLGPAIERAVAEARERSERQAMERALRESETRFRNVSASMMDVAFSCRAKPGGKLGLDWIVGAVGPLFGREASELMASGCWGHFVAPEDFPIFKGLVLDLAPGTSSNGSLRLLRSDGTHAWVDAFSRCEPGEDGGHRVFGALVDITRRKTGEEALERALRFNELIIDRVQEGIIVYDPDLRYQVWNPAMERMTGISAAQVLGRRPLDVFPFLEGSQVLASLETALQGVAHEPVDLPFAIPATGRRGWSSHANAPLRDPGGAIIGVIATITDITARKHQEQEIRRVNRLYALLSQLGQCLVRLGSRQELLDAFCSIAARTGGYPLVWVAWAEGEVEKVLPVALAGEEAGYLDGLEVRLDASPRGQGPAGRCIREGRPVVCADIATDPLMVPWRTAARSHGLCGAGAFPLKIRRQTVAAFMVYAREPGQFMAREVALLEEAAASLSYGLERFASEEEKAQLQAHFQQVQKMESLGVLAGGIAHDMNNVLAAILGMASAHLETLPAESPLRGAFGTIEKAASRGGEVVKALLRFARRTRYETAQVDLNDLIRDTERLLERTTLNRIRIELDLAPGLHPIQGDAGALANAVMNLCVNALDAIPGQGVLTLRTRNIESGAVEIQVEDTGTGMPPEILARAMEPFFTTKDVGKGTGLGLAMVYSTVNAHRGSLDLASTPGRGTCVTLRLPAMTVRPDGVPGPGGPVPGAPSPRLHILVVDDDDLVRESTAMMLQSLDHRAEVACGCAEAFALLEAGSPAELVILDVNMPGMTGLEALPHLRRLRPGLTVLLATGKADQAVLEAVEADPKVRLLPKPYGLRDLVPFLRR